MTRPISEMTRAELVDEVVRLQQRNADLAAHVEFCHKVLSMIENGPDYLVAKQYRALRLARERKPETSLARLKAKWQAEVLDKVLERIPGDVVTGGCDFACSLVVAQIAVELRQQSEGGET